MLLVMGAVMMLGAVVMPVVVLGAVVVVSVAGAVVVSDDKRVSWLDVVSNWLVAADGVSVSHWVGVGVGDNGLVLDDRLDGRSGGSDDADRRRVSSSPGAFAALGGLAALTRKR